MLTYDQQQTARRMYDELAHTRLHVILVPDRHQPDHPTRRLRAVETQNPAWYRRLCDTYPTNRTRPRRGRKFDTAIKRRHTLRALLELATTGHARTEYAHRLLPYVLDEHNRPFPEETPFELPDSPFTMLLLELMF